MENQGYTTWEAAELLGISYRTIRRWCSAGKLPGAQLRMGNRRLGWRIPYRLVDELARGAVLLSDGTLQLQLEAAAAS